MALKRTTFRQSDVTRAVKVVTAAGIKVSKVEISPDGKVAILFASGDFEAPIDPVDEWEAKKNATKN